MDRLEASAVADLLHYIARTALPPDGELVGLDRAVKAARALAIRARAGRVAGIDCMAPHPATVEAAMRARHALPATAPHRYPTWTVAPADLYDGGAWEIRQDGQLVDTVASHYAVDEVLGIAEMRADRRLAWVFDPDRAGFRSATAAEVAALAPGRVEATPAVPVVASDADTIRQAAAGWVVHPDIDCGRHRAVHVDRGSVAIRVFCTPDGVLCLATRQVCQGDVEHTTSVAQVLAWLAAEEAL
jgi:hypothetical protein